MGLRYVDRIKGLNSLRQYIKNLKGNKIILFLTPARKYAETNLNIIKMIINENKFSGIYITVNKPYNTLVKLLKDNGIDTDKIFFIDCISRTVSLPKGLNMPEEKIKEADNCLYIASPSRLTELGIALSQALSAMKTYEDKFLFLDSLSTLLIYNELPTIARFVHFLATRLRLFGLVGIIMSMEKEIDEKLILTLIELCDNVVEVD
jgi:hypothetical protein